MSTLDLFRYEDTSVRAKLIDGVPCILLADVIAGLGLKSSPAQVAQRLPEGVRRTDTLETAGGAQRAIFVTEAGLYRVVLRSDAPNAESFVQWVTEDVLPTIRETGRYGSDVEMLVALPSSKLLMMAAEAAQQAEAARARAAELEAPAAAWTSLASADGDFTVSDAAKILARDGIATGPRKLYGWLEDQSWVFRRAGTWHAMQLAVNAGLLVERITTGYFDQSTGERKQGDPQVRVTPKGLERMRSEMSTRIPTLSAVPKDVA